MFQCYTRPSRPFINTVQNTIIPHFFTHWKRWVWNDPIIESEGGMDCPQERGISTNTFGSLMHYWIMVHDDITHQFSSRYFLLWVVFSPQFHPPEWHLVGSIFAQFCFFNSVWSGGVYAKWSTPQGGGGVLTKVELVEQWHSSSNGNYTFGCVCLRLSEGVLHSRGSRIRVWCSHP